MGQAICGFEFCQPLVKAGLIPKDTRRIVVDIQVNEAVKVYYETYADKEMFELTVEELIKNKDRLEIKPIASAAG